MGWLPIRQMAPGVPCFLSPSPSRNATEEKIKDRVKPKNFGAKNQRRGSQKISNFGETNPSYFNLGFVAQWPRGSRIWVQKFD